MENLESVVKIFSLIPAIISPAPQSLPTLRQ